MVSVNVHGDDCHIPVMIIFLHISIMILPTTPLQFDFPTFSSFNPNINYEQSARTDGDVIQLAQDQPNLSIGRVTYAQPVHLWDGASGNLTDFTTTFSFVIDSHNIRTYGRYDEYNDGFAFFLAPNGSTIPENATGWSFGLMNNSSNSSQFVAVEFDTCVNRDLGDPGAIHVGIDINSISSVNATKWWARYNILKGRKNEASISYNGRTGKLSVAFTGWRHGAPFKDELSAVVNLTQYLPEFVTVGFSAAISNSSASQTLNSWSFNSSLGGVLIPARQTIPPVSSSLRTYDKHNTRLWIVLAVGVLCLF